MRLSAIAATVIFIALVTDEIGFAFKIRRLRMRRGPAHPRKPNRPHHTQHTRQRVTSSKHGKNAGIGGSKPPVTEGPAGSTESVASPPAQVNHGSGRGATVLFGTAMATESFASLAGAGTSIAETVISSKAGSEDGDEGEDGKNRMKDRKPAGPARMIG
uniref:Uncharacterized protein n=1 Tax=Rhipicephalus appendiculatus TaxID=34631 RepID=A0A131YC64_RHIAP